MPRAEQFGDLITADLKVLSEGCESRNNHRYAVVVQDLATQWIQPFQCTTKTSQETEKSLQKFLEPTRKPKVIYTHSSLEIGKYCEDSSWNHCTSTPHRSETNGIAERAVRAMKEGTSTVLLQSGLDEKWWAPCNVTANCETYQTSCLMENTPYERRFGVPFNGPDIPFGAMVENNHISAEVLSRQHQFGPKVLPGIFFRYALYAEGIWKGDILVADIEELEQMDASEIYARRLNAKEVLTPMSGSKLIFPVADGTVKISGGDQVLRTSTLIRDRQDRGEEQGNLPGESSLHDGERVVAKSKPTVNLVTHHPITAKDQSRIHQFGKKVLAGLFFGYALYAGRIWEGDILVADIEELETMDASEIYSKRLNAKEVTFPKKQENLFFQSQMDESNLLEEIKT